MTCEHRRTAGGEGRGAMIRCKECGSVGNFFLGGFMWHPPGLPPSREEVLAQLKERTGGL